MSLMFKHPFTCIVAGPTGCGKTQFTKRVIQYASIIIQPPPQKIVWCYGVYQKLFDEIRHVEFQEGLPKMNQFDGNERILLILDDLMRELSSSTSAVDIFTRMSHHMNISVMYLSQNVFYKGAQNRTISLNSQYFVLFKNPRDGQQISTLARQIFPTKWKFVLEAFSDATREPYTYLLLDLKPETEENLRVRGQIFPQETNFVYVSK